MSKLQGTNWSIELLPEWVGEHDEECSSIYHPDGVGALQISSYSKDSEVTSEDLKDFASDHIDAGAKLSQAETGEFKGFTFALGIDDEFWQYWYVSFENTALLITYNCELADREYEINKINKMVTTLKAT